MSGQFPPANLDALTNLGIYYVVNCSNDVWCALDNILNSCVFFLFLRVIDSKLFWKTAD